MKIKDFFIKKIVDPIFKPIVLISLSLAFYSAPPMRFIDLSLSALVFGIILSSFFYVYFREREKIFAKFYSMKCRKYREKIKNLELQISNLNTLLENNTNVLLNKYQYGEFYRIHTFIRFQDILTDIVNVNPIVDSAQIYRYSVRSSNNTTKIKVFFESGFAYENIETNVILQSYYNIKEEIYNELTRTIVPDWISMLKAECQSSKSNKLASDVFSYVKDSFNNIRNELRTICKKQDTESSDILEESYTNYRLLCILFRLLKAFL